MTEHRAPTYGAARPGAATSPAPGQQFQRKDRTMRPELVDDFDVIDMLERHGSRTARQNNYDEIAKAQRHGLFCRPARRRTSGRRNARRPLAAVCRLLHRDRGRAGGAGALALGDGVMAEQRSTMRLAFRREGEWWNAYIAAPGTMEGAILIGSIRFGYVHDKPKRRAAFMDIMKALIADTLKSVGTPIDEAASWEERPAPQHERAGRA